MSHLTHKTTRKRFRSLAANVGRVALSSAKSTTSCQISGTELFVQSLPEMMDVAIKRKSLKQTVKSVLTKKTMKNQIGGSASGTTSKPVKRNSRRK